MNTHKELSEKWKKLIEEYEQTHDQKARENLDAFVFWLISRAHE